MKTVIHPQDKTRDHARSRFRILMYSSYFPPQYSGAAKQAISLATELRDRGHHIEFITVKWPDLPDEDVINGFDIHRLEMGRGNKHTELRLWWNMLRFALKHKADFDIIHSHGAYYTNSIVGILGKVVGWKSLVKASLTNDDLHGMKGSLSGHIHYFLLRFVDAYIAISKDLAKEFTDADLPVKRIHNIPNGVDTIRFEPASYSSKIKLREKYGLPADKLVALSVGVFDRRKNIGWLIDQWINTRFDKDIYLLAVGPISREDKDASFFGSLKTLVETSPEAAGINQCVENIEEIYQAADFFILPSHSEGLPNVILEAMASGLPCIATDVGGTNELILNGKTGYTYTPGDAISLKNCINKLVAGDMSDIGSNARALAEECYSISAVAGKYEDLYKK